MNNCWKKTPEVFSFISFSFLFRTIVIHTVCWFTNHHHKPILSYWGPINLQQYFWVLTESRKLLSWWHRQWTKEICSGTFCQGKTKKKKILAAGSVSIAYYTAGLLVQLESEKWTYLRQMVGNQRLKLTNILQKVKKHQSLDKSIIGTKTLQYLQC